VPETPEEVRRRGIIPQQIKLRDEPEQVDQLDLSIAHDRVRDVMLPAPRVPNVEEVTNPRCAHPSCILSRARRTSPTC
jgi:hypothetical protein